MDVRFIPSDFTTSDGFSPALTPRVRHQPSQVVDLYKGEPLGCHYSNGILVSWVGFLSFSAASTPAWCGRRSEFVFFQPV